MAAFAGFAYKMAVFASPLLSIASGSVGGLTFLPSSGGMALRGKAVPVNPSTPQQNTVRGLLRYLIDYWDHRLTDAQRDAWTLYARNTPRVNRIGHSVILAGPQTWIRSQLPRLQAGLSLVPNAPTLFTVGAFTTISPFTVDSIAQRLIFAFDNTDSWATVSGSAMLVYIARPQNPSVTIIRRNYRFAGLIPGNTFLPPVSPTNIPLPFLFSIGQKCFFRVVVTRVDGRYTRSASATTSVT